MEENMKNEVMARVKSILNKELSDVIGDRHIHSGDNLIELGINSITFVKAAAIMESEFGVEFDDEDLNVYKFKTIGDIVEFLEEKL